ncbi:hypothetical protein IWQ61_008760 [Dispira simplex]|nr:hypothetical protein IWQ61_008760 [Dispira simplex]
MNQTNSARPDKPTTPTRRSPPREYPPPNYSTKAAPNEQKQSTRYSLRKRKAISLFPYSMLSWVNPETIPEKPRLAVDFSVLTEKLPAAATAHYRSISTKTRPEHPSPTPLRSTQRLNVNQVYKPLRNSRKRYLRETFKDKHRTWMAPAWRRVDQRYIPSGFRYAGLLATNKYRTRINNRIRFQPYRVVREVKTQWQSAATNRPRQEEGGETSQAFSLHGGHQGSHSTPHLTRRAINNAQLFSYSDDEYDYQSSQDLQSLFGTELPPENGRRARPTKLPRAITKRHLKGKLPASFLRVYQSHSQRDNLSRVAPESYRSRQPPSIPQQPHVARRRLPTNKTGGSPRLTMFSDSEDDVYGGQERSEEEFDSDLPPLPPPLTIDDNLFPGTRRSPMPSEGKNSPAYLTRPSRSIFDPRQLSNQSPSTVSNGRTDEITSRDSSIGRTLTRSYSVSETKSREWPSFQRPRANVGNLTRDIEADGVGLNIITGSKRSTGRSPHLGRQQTMEGEVLHQPVGQRRRQINRRPLQRYRKENADQQTRLSIPGLATVVGDREIPGPPKKYYFIDSEEVTSEEEQVAGEAIRRPNVPSHGHQAKLALKRTSQPLTGQREVTPRVTPLSDPDAVPAPSGGKAHRQSDSKPQRKLLRKPKVGHVDRSPRPLESIPSRMDTFKPITNRNPRTTPYKQKDPSARRLPVPKTDSVVTARSKRPQQEGPSFDQALLNRAGGRLPKQRKLRQLKRLDRSLSSRSTLRPTHSTHSKVSKDKRSGHRHIHSKTCTQSREIAELDLESKVMVPSPDGPWRTHQYEIQSDNDIAHHTAAFPFDPEDLPTDHEEFPPHYHRFSPEFPMETEQVISPASPRIRETSNQPEPVTLRFPTLSNWFHHDLVTDIPSDLTFSGKSYIGKGNLYSLVCPTTRAECLANFEPEIARVKVDQLHQERYQVFGQSVPLWDSVELWCYRFKENISEYERRCLTIRQRRGLTVTSGLDPNGSADAAVPEISRSNALRQLEDVTDFLDYVGQYLARCLGYCPNEAVHRVIVLLVSDTDYLVSDTLLYLVQQYTSLATDDILTLGFQGQFFRQSLLFSKERWRQWCRMPGIQLALVTLWYLVDWFVRLDHLLTCRIGTGSDDSGNVAGAELLLNLQREVRLRLPLLSGVLVTWLVRFELGPTPLNFGQAWKEVCFNNLICTWTIGIWCQLFHTFESRAIPFPASSDCAESWWHLDQRWADMLGVARHGTVVPHSNWGFWEMFEQVLTAQIAHYAHNQKLLVKHLQVSPLTGDHSTPEEADLTRALSWLFYQIEKAWAFTFTLLPWTYLDLHGVPQPRCRNNIILATSQIMSCLDFPLYHALSAIPWLLTQTTDTQKRHHGDQGNSHPLHQLWRGLLPRSFRWADPQALETYVKKTLNRLHHLVGHWRYALGTPSIVALYRYFSERKLDDLTIETYPRLPSFLITFPSDSPNGVTAEPWLKLDVQDTSFHVFLKLSALCFHYWSEKLEAVPDNQTRERTKLRKTILQTVAQLSPTRVMTFPFAPVPELVPTSVIPPTTHFTYAALGNHYALALLFLRVLPVTVRTTGFMAQMTSYLNFRGSDAIARRIFMEALLFALLILLQLQRDLGDVLGSFYQHWALVLDEYQSAVTLLQPKETLPEMFDRETPVRLTGQTKYLTKLAKCNVANYQRQQFKILKSGLGHFQRFMEMFSRVQDPPVNWALECLQAFLSNPPWLRLDPSSEAPNKPLKKDVIRLIRLTVRLLDHFARKVHPTSPVVVDPPTRPVSDTNGDQRWAFDSELDPSDLAALIALEEMQSAGTMPKAMTEPRASHTQPSTLPNLLSDTLAMLDRTATCLMRDWINSYCLQVGEHRLGSHRLGRTVQAALWCMADCARVMVEYGYTGWESFVVPFGTRSLHVIGHSALRRDALLTFLAPIVSRDLGIIEQCGQHMVTLWFETVADHRVTYQHVLTNALVNHRPTDRALFDYLHVPLHPKYKHCDLHRDDFAIFRNSLIDGVLSNMSDSFKSPTTSTAVTISPGHRYLAYLHALLSTMQECYLLEQNTLGATSYLMGTLHPMLSSVLTHCGPWLPEGCTQLAPLRFFTSGVLPSPPTRLYLRQKLHGFVRQKYSTSPIVRRQIRNFFIDHLAAAHDTWPLSSTRAQHVLSLVEILCTSPGQGGASLPWCRHLCEFRAFLGRRVFSRSFACLNQDLGLVAYSLVVVGSLRVLYQQLAKDWTIISARRWTTEPLTTEIVLYISLCQDALRNNPLNPTTVGFTDLMAVYWTETMAFLAELLAFIHGHTLAFPKYCDVWSAKRDMLLGACLEVLTKQLFSFINYSSTNTRELEGRADPVFPAAVTRDRLPSLWSKVAEALSKCALPMAVGNGWLSVSLGATLRDTSAEDSITLANQHPSMRVTLSAPDTQTMFWNTFIQVLEKLVVIDLRCSQVIYSMLDVLDQYLLHIGNETALNTSALRKRCALLVQFIVPFRPDSSDERTTAKPTFSGRALTSLVL